MVPRNAYGNGRAAEPDRCKHLLRTIVIVDREIAMLRHDHDIAHHVRQVLVHPEQAMLRFGHFFFNRIWRWYLHAALTAIRAQVKNSHKPQSSLGGILRSIPAVASSYPSCFANQPDVDRSEELLTRLQTEAKLACDLVDKSIAHRDMTAYPPDVLYDDLSPIIGLLDNAMGEVWHWAFGSGKERAVVDVDPYWPQLLFSKAWAPPTAFEERLSLGSEAHITTESGRRDFTLTAVYGRRPTDAVLRELGVTREEYEQQRDDS
jgi:hypothetical protein